MQFADLSHHQARFDFGEYLAVRPAIALKATEGTGFTDPVFSARWRACASIPRIAYHFARAKYNGLDEYRHFSAVLDSAGGFNPDKDIICLDVEDPETPARALVNAQQFVAAARVDGYTIGMIYTYPSYITEHNLFASAFPAGWRKLWYANYSAVSDGNMKVPPGWTRDQLYARQYTDKAGVAGVGVCDDSRVLIPWWRQGHVSTPADPPVKVSNHEEDGMYMVEAQSGTVLIVAGKRYSLNTAIVGSLRAQGVPTYKLNDKSVPGLYELGTAVLENTPAAE